MTTPVLDIVELSPNQAQPHITVNNALRRLEAVINLNVTDFVASVPQLSDSPPPVNGDRYILTANDFPGLEDDVAYYNNGWYFVHPEAGWQAVSHGDGLRYEFDGAAWNLAAGAGSAAVLIQVACSDLTTDLTTGTSKAYFRAPYAFTLNDVRSSLIDASSSGLVTVDINESGTTVLSTKLSIDATEKTSETAATPAVISDSSIADDAEITIDIDAAGTDAKGLIVTLIGVR